MSFGAEKNEGLVRRAGLLAPIKLCELLSD